MFLDRLNIWNFRKYGTKGTDEKDPGLSVEFKKGLNVLIGENDSGKTAIIDAIRYALNTKSYEQIRFDERDFFKSKGHGRTNTFEIECLFSGLETEEAANFLEWAHFNEDNEYVLRVHLKATQQTNNRITFDIKAGPENADAQMDGNARELLKVTYLKPLRDAQQELTPGYRSRLAQILLSHKDFQKEKDENGKYKLHEFEEIIKEANDAIKSKVYDNKTILKEINKYLSDFLHTGDDRKAVLEIAPPELQRILRSLSLEMDENPSGLGALNKLFMAAELLHLGEKRYNGLRLCLIEELEAHLHPQAQLRVIKALRDIKNTQVILTTHSTTLGASIPLKHTMLCHDKDVYPLWEGKTKLEEQNYKFLERFLDATKANLFFARGIILVEGDAENILIPTIAELVGKPLHKYGVSIVNVASTAFLHYANIFMRNDCKELSIPVAVITDLDVRAMEYYENHPDKTKEVYKLTKDVSLEKHDISGLYGNVYQSNEEIKEAIRSHIKEKRLPNGVGIAVDSILPQELTDDFIESLRETRKERLKRKFNNGSVKVFCNEKWTLEYDIALSELLRLYMAEAVVKASEIKKSRSYEIISNKDGLRAKVDALIEGEDQLEIAYKIFTPFIQDNCPSKAVTAQLLAELLRKNKSAFVIEDKNGTKRFRLRDDEYLKYIVDAIDHACDNQGISNA